MHRSTARVEQRAAAGALRHAQQGGRINDDSPRDRPGWWPAPAPSSPRVPGRLLGGLDRGEDLSPHLRSRQEVGDILRASGVPTIEFRASIVIGSGSLSFDMIRALVDRLPIMVMPKWVRARAQPIAIEDVVAYLLAGLDLDPVESGVFEI